MRCVEDLSSPDLACVHGEKMSGSAADNEVVYGYVKSPQQQPRGLKSTVYNPLNSALLPVSQLCSSVSQVDSTRLFLSVVNVKDKDESFINTKFGTFFKGSPLAYLPTMCLIYCA